MMFIATLAGTIKQINRTMKAFLWGFNSVRGTRKTPLISWSKLITPKEKGGLGLKNGAIHAQALLSKWVTRALDDPTS